MLATIIKLVSDVADALIWTPAYQPRHYDIPHEPILFSQLVEPMDRQNCKLQYHTSMATAEWLPKRSRSAHRGHATQARKAFRRYQAMFHPPTWSYMVDAVAAKRSHENTGA